jgi:hypothetical protein
VLSRRPIPLQGYYYCLRRGPVQAFVGSSGGFISSFSNPIAVTVRNFVTNTPSLFRYHSTNYDSFVEITPNDHGTKPLQDLRQIWDPDVIYRPDEPTKTTTTTIPTPLQAHTIPLFTMGYDVLVNATGTQATVSTTYKQNINPIQ